MTDNTPELDKIIEHAYNAGYSAKDMVKQAILDWHNKQMSELLDRLASGEVYWHAEDDVDLVPLSAIEAERNQLKEVK